jgi:replicative DNA helicase
LIPVDGARDRTQAVNEAIMASKELSLDVRCPLVLCVQAARGVDKYETKIPTAGDCQWASAIEQTCDKLLGIWRPSLTEQAGATIEVNKKDLVVHDRLFIAKLLKQRMEKAGQIFALNFAPEFVRLSDIEINNTEVTR